MELIKISIVKSIKSIYFYSTKTNILLQSKKIHSFFKNICKEENYEQNIFIKIQILQLHPM